MPSYNSCDLLTFKIGSLVKPVNTISVDTKSTPIPTGSSFKIKSIMLYFSAYFGYSNNPYIEVECIEQPPEGTAPITDNTYFFSIYLLKQNNTSMVINYNYLKELNNILSIFPIDQVGEVKDFKKKMNQLKQLENSQIKLSNDFKYSYEDNGPMSNLLKAYVENLISTDIIYSNLGLEPRIYLNDNVKTPSGKITEKSKLFSNSLVFLKKIYISSENLSYIEVQPYSKTVFNAENSTFINSYPMKISLSSVVPNKENKSDIDSLFDLNGSINHSRLIPDIEFSIYELYSAAIALTIIRKAFNSLSYNSQLHKLHSQTNRILKSLSEIFHNTSDKRLPTSIHPITKSLADPAAHNISEKLKDIIHELPVEDMLAENFGNKYTGLNFSPF